MKRTSKAVLISALLIFILILMTGLASKSTEPAVVSEPAFASEPAVPSYVRCEFEPVPFYYEHNVPEIVYYDVPLDEEIQDYIRDTLDEFNLDISNGFELVLAIAHTESRFNTDSENGSCKGIMQVSEIHKEKLDELKIQDLFDPYDCFRAGIYFLKCGFDNADSLWEEIDGCELSKDEFRLNCALMSYNLGNYGAEKKVKNGVYSTSYVEKVRKAMANLEVKNE